MTYVFIKLLRYAEMHYGAPYMLNSEESMTHEQLGTPQKPIDFFLVQAFLLENIIIIR